MINENTKWYNLIDYNEFYKNIKDNEYSTDEENQDDEFNNLNMIDINPNNTELLNKINNIILISNYKKYTSLELLKYQDIIATYINKTVQNNFYNKDIFIKCILFLKKLSEYLAHKVKQKVFVHNNNFLNDNKIIRSSYKFCNYKHKCTYNYNKHKKACYADHFPHNMIYADCDILLKFIEKYYEDEINIQNKEIIRCINTISYVIKHMVEELSNLCLYIPSKDHDKYHNVKLNNLKNNKI